MVGSLPYKSRISTSSHWSDSVKCWYIFNNGSYISALEHLWCRYDVIKEDVQRSIGADAIKEDV